MVHKPTHQAAVVYGYSEGEKSIKSPNVAWHIQWDQLMRLMIVLNEQSLIISRSVRMFDKVLRNI